MKYKLYMAAAVAIMIAPLFLMNSAVAANTNSSVCSASAIKMKTSCNFEVKEEYQATVAHCINFSDYDDRVDCRAEARETFIEDKEGCRAQKDARRAVCDLLQEDRYDPDPLTDPTLAFVEPNTIGDSTMPNPYFSLVAGTTQVLRAGEDFEEIIVVHVTEDVREILGVAVWHRRRYRRTCRR